MICRPYSWLMKLRRMHNDNMNTLDDVITWKHFPRYWNFVRRIPLWPVNSHHKGQWRGTLMFSLICAWTNGWVNNRNAGGLRRHRSHYDVTVMWWRNIPIQRNTPAWPSRTSDSISNRVSVKGAFVSMLCDQSGLCQVIDWRQMCCHIDMIDQLYPCHFCIAFEFCN